MKELTNENFPEDDFKQRGGCGVKKGRTKSRS